MADEKKQILICDCEGTMELDAKSLSRALDDEGILTQTNLCRSQIETLSIAAVGNEKLTIACTQEIPIFLESMDELDSHPRVNFVNIRERAGWSQEGGKATPKIAALIAEAQLEIEPAKNLALSSEGNLLILGHDEKALEAAKRLSERLNVTLVFVGDTGKDVMPSQLTEFPVFIGKIDDAKGYLGNFEVGFSGLSPCQASSKESFSFQGPAKDTKLNADLILDMSGGEPLFNAPQKRDGYFNPALNDPVRIERAFFDLSDMVGEFEKPKYVNYDVGLCAHSRNGVSGCSICIDLCPTGAVTSADEAVAYDPYICAGCGSCAGSCPTGAAEYAMPNGIDALARLRTLLGTYLKAGGKQAAVLVHDREFGDELISVIARTGKGLPANVLPFLLNEVTQAGLDFLMAAVSYGVAQVLVLAPPHKRDEQEGLIEQINLSNKILRGMGYGDNPVSLVDDADPDALVARLYALSPPASVGTATFMALGHKRQRLNQILESLHQQSPKSVDVIELEPGAPFGAIVVDAEGCTLCLSCVNACPAKALRDNPDAPELKFQESNCIQCGLCKTTCPENVITLNPRIDFKAIGAQALILKQEEPFHCIRCDKPFGVGSTIEKMIEKVSGHAMFQDQKSLDRLRMCDDCRIIDMAEGEDHPWASKQRTIKSTDDYLREREELRKQASEAMEGEGPEEL